MKRTLLLTFTVLLLTPLAALGAAQPLELGGNVRRGRKMSPAERKGKGRSRLGQTCSKRHTHAFLW